MQNSEYRRIGDLREINSDKRRISAKNINSDKHPPIFKKNKYRKHGALRIRQTKERGGVRKVFKCIRRRMRSCVMVRDLFETGSVRGVFLVFS